MSAPDDLGVEPTNDPSVRVLWERCGNVIDLSLMVEDDPLPAPLFPPPPGMEQWWAEQVRTGKVHVIQTDWTDQ